MNIKHLNTGVISKIRSFADVSNVAQCVYELVCNSLDAQSTAIAVRINLVKFRIQVADNGSGISRQNLERVGIRYATNKCQTVKDLEGHLKTYGFRGESLASIAEMSRGVTITSRHRTSNDTFSKSLSRDGQSEVKPEKFRASVGTTVTVLDWLSPAPVRQQRIVQEIELEEVKKQLESLIIINPGTSFTLRNDVTGMLIINSPKYADIVEAFHRLHPEAGASFSLLKVSKGKIRIELLIEKESAPTKEWQFLYVNKRPVHSAKISQRFQKAFHSNKLTKRYPVFIMNIKCPQLCVDSLHKSASSEVEFTCWTQVLACVDKLIKAFLGVEIPPKPSSALPRQKQFSSGISQLMGAVQATAYKRKTIAESHEAGATKIRRLQVIEDMTQTTGDYGIEDSVVQLPPAKALRQSPKTKRPLGIVVVPTKRSPPKQASLERFDQRSVYSKLNTDENRGKDLILDMFLKSTQVFKEQSEDASQATIEESNYVLENNIADTARGINTTMSISINVKKRRAPRAASGHSQWPQNMSACSARQCSRTLIKRQSLDEQATEGHLVIGPSRAVCHKSVQTSQKLNQCQLDQSSMDLNDDYTILVNSEPKEHNYLFVRREKDAQVEDTTAIKFEPLKLCHCEHREGNLFNFREVDGGCKRFAEWWPVLQGSEAKSKQPRGSPKPELFQTAMTKRKGESEAGCTTSLLFRGLKRQPAAYAPSGLPCMQSPYFGNENKTKAVSKVSPFKQFRPPFRSTQINKELFSPYFQHNTTGHDPSKQLLKKPCCLCNSCPRRYGVFNRLLVPRVPNPDQRASTSAELAQLLNSKNKIQFKKPICRTTALREKEIGNQSPKSFSWAPLAGPKIEQFKNTQNNWFNFSSSPDIFSGEFHSPNDAEALSKLNALCDLEQFGLLPARAKTQSPIRALEISLPSARERQKIIEQELNAFAPNLTREELLRPPCLAASQDESKLIMDSQNQWMKCFNRQGSRFFVNRRTGMATVKSPVLTQTNFAFEERLDFVPKGMSPVLNQHKKVDGILSENAKNKLHSLILEGYEDELMSVKWRLNCRSNDQKAFFEEIYREKSKQYEQCIPRVSNMKAQPHKVNFSRSAFESLEVIGQLDQKFLVAHESFSDLLVLFDQHAVDERIRVERFLKEYKGRKIAHKHKLTIFLPHNDLALLQTHQDYLDSVGLGVQFFSNGLHITHIPLCIHEKFTGQGEPKGFNDLLNALVKEAVEFLKTTRGSTALSMPRIVQDVINLKACRGAIKFGDALKAEECTRLLQDLALCQLPFQCAHGRPTLTPVVTLHRLQNSELSQRPHLRKLLQCTGQQAGR